MLRRIYGADSEINLEEVIRRAASDPIKPVRESGKLRPRIALVILSVVVLLLVSSFFYFSVGSRG